MEDNRTDEEKLRQRISENLAYYRKQAGFTQSGLAERINYSDKSVSKWERAVASPDIYVLTMLAELYGVTVNDLIDENVAVPRNEKAALGTRRVVSCLQVVVFVWLIATAAFAMVTMMIPDAKHAWYAFLYAVPVSCAVLIVFAVRLWKKLTLFCTASAFVWTVSVTMFIVLPLENSYLLFTVAGVAQVLVILGFIRQILNDRAHKVARRK
ncbi:MAG: helix-turn-helix domain-containing protein [Oscillospiraceae bacterium]|jgi:transcriptional regulator with XRE-family HTH domain|nr:helix-turn-helix domain-containing protein [Oscillospiraceae bacterium]